MRQREILTWLCAARRAHSTQQHWPFPADKTETGYAYVLTHPGTPCIFYDDLWSHGEKLRELVALRKRADLTSRSNVEILAAKADMYVARIDKKCAACPAPAVASRACCLLACRLYWMCAWRCCCQVPAVMVRSVVAMLCRSVCAGLHARQLCRIPLSLHMRVQGTCLLRSPLP